jgi:hypothetical protein
MDWVLHAIHHPTGVWVVPILLGAFVAGFGVQRVLAAAGNRWWPVPGEQATVVNDDRARSEAPVPRVDEAAPPTGRPPG